MPDGPFRAGRVHVLSAKCATCIFRPVSDGRLAVRPGRVGEMVTEARANDSAIHCHSTLYDDSIEPAVCRGFYDLPHPTTVLQLAERLGLIEWDPPPAK